MSRRDDVRADLSSEGRRRPAFRTPTASMGEPVLPLDEALRLAGELEDEQLLDRPAVDE